MSVIVMWAIPFLLIFICGIAAGARLQESSMRGREQRLARDRRRLNERDLINW